MAFQLVVSVGKYYHAFALNEIEPNGPQLESYIVMMKEEPILTHDIDTKQGRNLQKGANSNKNKKYKKKLKNKHAQVAKKAGFSKKDLGQEYYYCSNGFQAFMTSEQADEIRNQEGVALVAKDQKMISLDDGMPQASHRRLEEGSSSSPSIWSNQGRPPKSRDLTNDSPQFLNLNDPEGPWANGYDGEGVVVGVIDGGIWPEHSSFDDDDLPCDFGNAAHNPEDVAFNCTNKLFGARTVLDAWIKAEGGIAFDEFYSARDHYGHGTHTASTAAGNKNVDATFNNVKMCTEADCVIKDQSFSGATKISGVGHRARIIAYKALVSKPDRRLKISGYESDIMKAIDYACQDRVDVINFSVGSSEYDILASVTSMAFLNADRAGIVVAAAAGNDGPFSSSVYNTVPWITTVAASTQEVEKFKGQVVHDDWEVSGASLTDGTDEELPLVDAADAGSELCLLGKLDEATVKGKIVLCKRGEVAQSYLEKSKAVSDAGGKGMILYNPPYPVNSDSDEAEYEIRAEKHSVPSVHISTNNGNKIKEYNKTAGTEAVAKIVAPLIDKESPFMASFSSRGPNRQDPGIIKPDITAPGVDILAGFSPKSNMHHIDSPPGLFAVLSGTSMAAPHVAVFFYIDETSTS